MTLEKQTINREPQAERMKRYLEQFQKANKRDGR